MDPQNLLILMSDQHNPKMMGCTGNEIVKTPNLDKLAARGTRFSAAYSNSPICVPARASFMTGRYVHRIGYWDNAMAYDGRIPGWGHRLRQLKIPVESIGKLHFRNEMDDTGFGRQTIPMHIKDGIGQVWGSVREPLPVREGGEMMVSFTGAGSSDYNKYDLAVTKSTCEWLRQEANKPREGPWVLYAGLVAPHFPYIVPEEFFSLYPLAEIVRAHAHPEDGYVRHPWVEQFMNVVPGIDRNSDEERRIATAAYMGLCSFLDYNIGRILDVLEQTGLAETTRVIYTSDHGDMIGSRGQWGKSLLYDDSAGIPMIMAGKDITENHICETPVSLVDLYPTILESVGQSVSHNADESLPGRSLYGFMDAEYDPQRIVFSEYHAYGAPSGAFMLRQGHYKFNYYVGFEPELFDLNQDPLELNNLAAEKSYADRVRYFERRLRELLDPEAIDRKAKADQAKLVENFGGIELALNSGTKAETPPPKV
jgi:choline-sulfatase